ncbi:MAG: HD domain-containing protein, partial [Oscillospiraceae bacterium]
NTSTAIDSGYKKDVYSSYASSIYALMAAIDAKDHYTFNHSQNVAYYATTLSALYGHNSDTIEIIREAALLHDIGKISIPETILNKEDKLSNDEFRTMQQHVDNSIGIIKYLPSLDYVIPAVIGHHERFDGLGYPRKIAGENIPITARILTVADSFDAMVSKRCYKQALSVETALERLAEQAGKQFDKKLVELFIEGIKTEQIIPIL